VGHDVEVLNAEGFLGAQGRGTFGLVMAISPRASFLALVAGLAGRSLVERVHPA
jgi:hypothetical protein